VKHELTAKRLREVLHYDPETGVFTWAVTLSQRAIAGSVAGSVHASGYRYIGIDGQRYPAQRLAWLYMTGEWPSDLVDHENLTPGDDRWSNLREATRAQNAWNAPCHRDNTTGFKGVYWHKAAGKWMAQIKANGRLVYLGLFTDINAAAAAYAGAAHRFHGEFARAE